MHFQVRPLAAAAALLFYLSSADLHAAEAFEFSGSGFFTGALGKVISGTHDPASNQGFKCPCFIADYAQGGVYEEGKPSFGPDSKLGLQGSVFTSDKRFGLTGQVVSRGSVNGKVNLEWLYGTAEVTPSWRVQAGRMRLPLFSYSQVQDVGFAVPWIHLPPQLYGWEIVNYNGLSFQHQKTWGSVNTSLNLFLGSETQQDSGYWRVYNGKQSRTDAKWSKIIGVEAKLSKGPYEGRLLYMESDTQNKAVSAGATSFTDPKRQKVYGLSLGIDQSSWFAKTEFLYLNRNQDYGTDRSQLYSVGLRMGPWTPLLSYSNYQQVLNSGAPPEGHSNTSLVLRYDLNSQSALKAQLDFWQDKTPGGFASPHGNARVFTISYDRVF